VSFPAGLTLVTVAIRFDLPPSGGASGVAQFSAPYALTGPTDNSIVPPFTKAVTLAADGTGTVQLPATNDPDWTPQGWAYNVVVQLGSATVRGTLQLDYLTASVQLADLLQVDGAATPGVTYATLAQLTAAQVSLSAATATVASDLAVLTPSVVRASDLGLVAHSFPASGIVAGTIVPTAGLLQVVRVRALSGVATNIELYVTVAGSGLTAGRCFAALFNDAGALLGAGAVTADQSGLWNSTGRKSMALTVAQGITANAWYRVGFFANGTTLPTFGRGADLGAAGAALIGGLSAPYRYSTADTGLTTAMPANIGTQTAIGTAWWAAIS
jgi:hypothetical protein